MPEVIMPRLSDTMEEGELSRWLKNVGDQIHKGDVLAEIETDKATMDLESFDEGVLEQQLVEAGTLVPIGQAVAVIGDGSKSAAEGKRDTAEAATETPAPETGAPEAATEPASKPGSAPAQEGEPAPRAAQPDEPAPSAAEPAEQADGEQDEEAPAEAEQTEAEQKRGGTQRKESANLRTSPLARKIAHEHGIDLASLSGTGPQGRITRADVEDAIASASSAEAESAEAESTEAKSAEAKTAKTEKAGTAQAAEAETERAEAETTAGEDDEEVPLNKIRRVTARRLTESQAVPHFFLTSVVDVEALIALRTEINTALSDGGRKVSINDLLVRACALALRQHPDVNSSWGGDKLLRHGRINIGVAVATANGLVVPVVTGADRKTLGDIAAETVELAGRARAGRLKPQEMSGGTFTISNLGMFGIDQFTAVINPPEAAILAVGAAADVPVVRDGRLVSVPKLKITLTVDHRVLDGATAAAFLRDLTGILEAPFRIML